SSGLALHQHWRVRLAVYVLEQNAERDADVSSGLLSQESSNIIGSATTARERKLDDDNQAFGETTLVVGIKTCPATQALLEVTEQVDVAFGKLFMQAIQRRRRVAHARHGLGRQLVADNDKPARTRGGLRIRNGDDVAGIVRAVMPSQFDGLRRIGKHRGRKQQRVAALQENRIERLR